MKVINTGVSAYENVLVMLTHKRFCQNTDVKKDTGVNQTIICLTSISAVVPILQ